MYLLDKLWKEFVYFGMPVVTAYHLVAGNLFLNTAAEDARGLEEVGNFALAPFQFLFCGAKAVLENGEYRFEQRFVYEDYLLIKGVASVVSLPFSLPAGAALKGIAYLWQETRHRHEKLLSSQLSTKVKPNIEYYRSVGLDVEREAGFIDPPQHRRRPGHENRLMAERELLKQITTLFHQNNIPYWLDCGSCIGAFRYGGCIPWDWDIDLAVLLPDFDNIMHVLNQLDKEKYMVEDWSGRDYPKSFMRVYIKENRNHIDVYHFKIDPTKKKLTYLFSNGESIFMPESWKIEMRRFTFPTDFKTVFPLKKAYFDGLEVFVPNDIVTYLQERYGENLNPVRIYNEITDEYEKDLSHPYWKIPYAQ
jgi:hypothetical protein